MIASWLLVGYWYGRGEREMRSSAAMLGAVVIG
jgi:hypothetical protein